MHRNLAHQPEETRYSATNPPPSIAKAQERIGAVQTNKARTEEDLRRREPGSFRTGNDYRAWQRKANAAVVWMAGELAFLEGWIKRYAQLQTVTELLRGARALADEIRASYSPIYQDGNMPVSVARACERWQTVNAIAERISGELYRTRRLGKQNGLTKSDIIAAKQPVLDILWVINAEAGVLQEYLRTNDPTWAHPMDTKELTEAAKDVLAAINTSLEKIREEYSPLYTRENPPKHLLEGEQRLRLLAPIRQKIDEALRNANDEGEQCHLNKLTLKHLKTPLVELSVVFNAERALIQGLISNRALPKQRQTSKTQPVQVPKKVELKHAQSSPVTKTAEERTRHEELQQTAQHIRARAQELTQILDADYSRVYHAGNLPPNREDASQRLTALTASRVKVQDALTEITGEWTQHPLSREALPGVKRPIVRILSTLENETRLVKQYLQSQTEEKPLPGRHWKTICFLALERAAKEGFVMTTEEQEVFDLLSQQIIQTPANAPS